MLTAALALPLTLLNSSSAQAAPAVYQLEGGWVSAPATTTRGDLLMSEWRVNVNDGANPPSNDPVENVVFTAIVDKGVFTTIPTRCAAAESSISPDGTSLTCALGTVNMGTAIVLQTPARVTGATAEKITITGTVASESLALLPIPIANDFGMDMVWETPTSWYVHQSNATVTNFPWTLNLLNGSDLGPDSVSFDLTVETTSGTTANLRLMDQAPYPTGGCFAFDPSQGQAPQHPYSKGAAPSQSAPFSGCTITPTGTGTFKLTLSGIDYSLLQIATHDSMGNALANDRAAVASGLIGLAWDFNTADNGAVGLRLSSSAATFTSQSGLVSQDNPANNISTKAIPGITGFSSAWNRSYTNGGGSAWDDSYRVSPGTVIQQEAIANEFGYGQALAGSEFVGVCSVIDSRYVLFSDYLLLTGGMPVNTSGMAIEYYTGTPSSDPNTFSCDAGGADPGATGWVSTLPTDLSSISAVRIQATAELMQARLNGQLALYVRSTLKQTTLAGQDVWQFGALRIGGTQWLSPQRSVDGAGVITTTANAQYPYTTATRDLFRVTAANGNIEKIADRFSAKHGDSVNFTLSYTANRTGAPAAATLDGVILTDTLPVGLTYVPGSVSPEPVISGQKLTWTLDAVPYNTKQTLAYAATVDGAVVPGTILTNAVALAVPGDDRDASTTPGLSSHADVAVADDGATSIGKVADSPFIPNPLGNGDGDGSWTVTIKSADSQPQAFTDIIDILPYNGDGRGTTFTGSYDVTDVVLDASGGTVYYTDVDPATLNDDADHPSNGAANVIAGNTVGWTTVKPAKVTGIRVIAGQLAPTVLRSFQVKIHTLGASGNDVYVNRAQGRAGHTELVMRTSAKITIAPFASASLKKYVQDLEGVWHDANDPSDYPSFHVGDDVNFRIVIKNTGQSTLTNLVVKDDLYPDCDFTVDSLVPGAEADTECTMSAVEGTTVNTASATADTPPGANPPVIPDDPAGYVAAVKPTLLVEKSADPASGSTVPRSSIVNYTVTATNTSTAPTAVLDTVTITDDLSKVFTNADYVADSAKAVLDGVDATAPVVADTTLSWTGGPLAVGKSVVLTYQVKVHEQAPAKAVLVNVVIAHGNTKGGKVDSNCIPGTNDPRCTTTHDVPEEPTVPPTTNPPVPPTVPPTTDPSTPPTVPPTTDPSTPPTVPPTMDPSVPPTVPPTTAPPTAPSTPPVTPIPAGPQPEPPTPPAPPAPPAPEPAPTKPAPAPVVPPVRKTPPPSPPLAHTGSSAALSMAVAGALFLGGGMLLMTAKSRRRQGH